MKKLNLNITSFNFVAFMLFVSCIAWVTVPPGAPAVRLVFHLAVTTGLFGIMMILMEKLPKDHKFKKLCNKIYPDH